MKELKPVEPAVFRISELVQNCRAPGCDYLAKKRVVTETYCLSGQKEVRTADNRRLVARWRVSIGELDGTPFAIISDELHNKRTDQRTTDVALLLAIISANVGHNVDLSQVMLLTSPGTGSSQLPKALFARDLGNPELRPCPFQLWRFDPKRAALLCRELASMMFPNICVRYLSSTRGQIYLPVSIAPGLRKMADSFRRDFCPNPLETAA